MREHPIIFSGPMVRAILEGRKTQTRRVIKPQPNSGPNGSMVDLMGGEWGLLDGDLSGNWRCPYGQPGDRLWVRETWSDANSDDGPCVLYRADNDRRYLVRESYPVDYAKYPGADFGQWAADVESGAEGRWRPSIHMPRWASRITLEITDVRVERVQDITEDDAAAEGCSTVVEPDGSVTCGRHKTVFRELWDSINAKRGFGWNANPWVWALTFKRVEE